MIFDDDMSYDMACQAMAKTIVKCQLTCKKFPSCLKISKKYICITYLQVHFFSVDFFACELARVNMPFTKHRCVLPKELTSADKDMLQ